MSKNKKQRKRRRSIKRLKHHRHLQPLQNLPYNIINENLFKKSNSKYNKYFDYPLPELLADHSTDPMQNTVRQYVLSDISNEGRFINHEMIIRKNGESTILRPKQDIVLVNGFIPIIRPSYLLLSYQSMPIHSQIAPTSSSIINKISINKRKRKKRQRKRKSKIQKINKQISVHDLSSNNHQNQSHIHELEDICFNRNTNHKLNDDIQFSYDLSQKEHNQINYDFLRENICLSSSDILKM